MPDQPVMDVNSGCDLGRQRHHAKLKPIRGQNFQIPRVAEEPEHVVQRPGNPLFAMNGVSQLERRPYRTTPASGLLALAYSFFGMRPAKNARRPA